MFTLTETNVMYDTHNKIMVLGHGETVEQVKDILNEHISDCAKLRLDHPDAPEAVKDAARDLVWRCVLGKMEFDIQEDGTVWINGLPPECDWFTITEE